MPSSFCTYFPCIPSFWQSTRGYAEECVDGKYSHSGGRPGACSYHSGALRPVVAFFATVLQFTELSFGIVLLLGALEVGRRRFSGRLGREHGYEAPVALIAALAGLAVAGLTLSIAILMGEQLPTIMPGRAFDTAIPVELLIVPLGVAVAVMETGRFLALFRHRRGQIVASGRPQVIPVNESKRAS